MIEFFNTPSVWYKLVTGCYWTLGYVYLAGALLSRPFFVRKTLVIAVCASLFGWLWNVFGSTVMTIYLPGYYVFFFLLLVFFYKQNWRNAIFLELIHYFSVGFLIRLMNWFYQAFGGRSYVEAGISHWSDLWIHLVTAGAMFLILYFVRLQVHKIADYRLTNREFLHTMVVALPLAFSYYGMTLFSIYVNDFPLVVLVVWSVMSLGVMLDLVIGRKQQQELIELRVMEQRLQDQYQRHLVKVESSELIMQKCHDLQKYLRLFEETSNRGYLKEYQAELKETIAAYDSVYETGNATLDSVLSEASRKCQGDQITLICMADGNLVHFIQPADICSIFGNALDNAIESARALSDPEKKIIHLKIIQEKYMVLIRVENYYDHEVDWQDGELVTSKADKANHGYGLKSIRYAVEKYDGNVRVATEEGKFTLTLLINR
jgi:hypothetical protein